PCCRLPFWRQPSRRVEHPSTSRQNLKSSYPRLFSRPSLQPSSRVLFSQPFCLPSSAQPSSRPSWLPSSPVLLSSLAWPSSLARPSSLALPSSPAPRLRRVSARTTSASTACRARSSSAAGQRCPPLRRVYSCGPEPRSRRRPASDHLRWRTTPPLPLLRRTPRPRHRDRARRLLRQPDIA